MATLTLALVLSALVVMWIAFSEEVPETSLPRVEAPVVSASDVPGVDVPGLPRYPGSTRVEYGHEIEGGLTMTRARYAVVAELDAVREFYRQVFRTEGWSEVDVRFSNGRWNFLVVNGEREARMRIASDGAIVEIVMRLSEPILPRARSGADDAGGG